MNLSNSMSCYEHVVHEVFTYSPDIPQWPVIFCSISYISLCSVKMCYIKYIQSTILYFCLWQYCKVPERFPHRTHSFLNCKRHQCLQLHICFIYALWHAFHKTDFIIGLIYGSPFPTNVMNKSLSLLWHTKSLFRESFSF